ncbi:pirin [Rickettsia endosymbiont of Cantharis rufa]|uniref:pirin n=1 Tax=Rickettsia endosymbiont of Cantharis rufa TaxID=3066248 RepID=UPI003132A87A
MLSCNTGARSYFQTSAQLWINLQARYDLKLAQRNEWSYIKNPIRTMEIARKAS